jgi:hypothetical protein
VDNIFSRFAGPQGIGSTRMHAHFDAEQGTPELIDALAAKTPQIRKIMASLREGLPLVPHAGIGPQGRFYRLPNHYRSVSFLLPPEPDSPDVVPGVIVFKGTEPLLADFPAYFDWMLNAPFRASQLPLALHFPLDMKLPPAAMWIEECVAEQAVSSAVQRRYLARHGQLAQLPLPLFVFQMTTEQNRRYEDCISGHMSADAMWKIRNKLNDGLGVEVYYYPELPVRASDLFVGNVKNTFKACLAPEQIEGTFSSWAQLMAELLCLNYMPYAPWHHGMGGCVDPGNVCIDGGFNDLLTLVPFDAIPDEVLFRRSLQASIQMLSESMAAMSAASLDIPAVTEADAAGLAAAYLNDRLGERIRAIESDGHAIDPRLKAFFQPPNAADILHLTRKSHRGRGKAQYLAGAEVTPLPRPTLVAANG